MASLTAAPLYLCLRGQGLNIFRDRLRLVLITFVASSALWALIAFIATLMDPANPTGCQVAVIFAAFFDQVARCAMEQYLLWAINSGLKISPDTFAPQLVLVIRFFLGGVYVGFQRPQLDPVCQPTNEMNAIGIAVAATDAVVIALFVLRSFVIGLVKDVRESRPGARRSKALLLLIATLLLWTGVSLEASGEFLLLTSQTRQVYPCFWASSPSISSGGRFCLRGPCPFFSVRSNAATCWFLRTMLTSWAQLLLLCFSALSCSPGLELL